MDLGGAFAVARADEIDDDPIMRGSHCDRDRDLSDRISSHVAAIVTLVSTPKPAPTANYRQALEAAIKVRRVRNTIFNSHSLGEPVWDMLLDLALAEIDGRQISVSSLCIAANVPTTTALRYIRQMVDVGDIVRIDDPRDQRRSYVALSPRVSGMMQAWAERIRLPIE